MQHDAQLWNDLLWASGGRLELPKCGYHTIYYLFHENGIPYLQHHHHHQISLEAPNGDTIPIRPKNIFTPRKNLGHHKAPGGNYRSQQEIILEKAAQVTDGIIKSGASRTDATLLYETVYRPSVEYTIPQSFMTPSQLRQIERQTLPRLYARCGYNRNTS